MADISRPLMATVHEKTTKSHERDVSADYVFLFSPFLNNSKKLKICSSNHWETHRLGRWRRFVTKLMSHEDPGNHEGQYTRLLLDACLKYQQYLNKKQLNFHGCLSFAIATLKSPRSPPTAPTCDVCKRKSASSDAQSDDGSWVFQEDDVCAWIVCLPHWEW